MTTGTLAVAILVMMVALSAIVTALKRVYGADAVLWARRRRIF